MKIKFTLICLFLSSISFAQVKSVTLPLIPLPSEITMGTDSFNLTTETKIITTIERFKTEIAYFNNYLNTNYGFELQQSNAIPSDGNYILLSSPETKTGALENYNLSINQNQVFISTEDNAGLFYAFQTIMQILPLDKKRELKLPSLVIKDTPNYSWRGMHLDCSRHFFTKDEVKKYISYLAMYKFNTFHWHLVDDQGWRIEIKKYPLLTIIGSHRKETIIGKPAWDKDGKPSKDDKYDATPYGGYYTQDDIKEIIAYATERHITIVPEIEMPGHSLAALAAYPQFSCTGGPFEVFTKWGVADDVFCAGNDSTFLFIQDILTEVINLFPGKYIHIGGDECLKDRWKACTKCQKRIADEHLKNESELQSYFITRIEKFVNAKQRQIIGWDEILEGGLAPNAAVMSWRGTEGGIAAAKLKHNVVMTPGKPCYFDHYQAKDKNKEPLAIGGFNPLDSVYAYNPTPKALSADDAKYILGAQGNVWTEYIPMFLKVEYMTMPRMAALAEVLWTPPDKKNYKNFIVRLKTHSKLLDKMKISYAKHF